MAPNIPERLKSIVGSREPQSSQQPHREYVFSPSTTSIRPIIVSALFIVVCSIGLLWLNRPQTVTAPVVVASGTLVSPSSSTSSPQLIVVDVEGKVRRPGLHTLPPHARVADAIAAAGGLQRGVARANVNLAALVADGQLLVVGLTDSSGVMPQSAPSQGALTSSLTVRINANTATESEFEALPGVGPVLAARLVQWREAHGRFQSVSELQDVPGIGPKVFERLSQYIAVS